jgi:hypothetical protein
MPRCKYELRQGPRKGEKCKRPVVEGSTSCTHHTPTKTKYNKIINADKKYNSLVRKVETLMKEDNDLLTSLQNETAVMERELYGVRLFIRPSYVHRESDLYDEHIPYEGKHLHNALRKKETLKKRIKENHKEMAKIVDRVLNLELSNIK